MVRLTWLATTCICAAFSILYLLARDPGRVAGGFAAGNSSSSSSRSDPLLQMPFGAFAFEVHGRVSKMDSWPYAWPKARQTNKGRGRNSLFQLNSEVVVITAGPRQVHRACRGRAVS